MLLQNLLERFHNLFLINFFIGLWIAYLLAQLGNGKNCNQIEEDYIEGYPAVLKGRRTQAV
jgi:hypothetical protein